MEKMRVTMGLGAQGSKFLGLGDIVYGTLALTMSESEIHCPIEGELFKVVHMLRVGNELVMIAHKETVVPARVIDLRRSFQTKGDAGVLVRADMKRYRVVGARGGDEIGCGPLVLNLEEVPG